MQYFNPEVSAREAYDKFIDSQWNCAESVLYGVLSQTTLSEQEITERISLISGFNGGIGGSRNLCGAVSGAVAAIGVMTGRFGIEDKDNAMCSALSKEFVSSFQAKFHTIECKALLESFNIPVGGNPRTHCSTLVQYAAEHVAVFLNNRHDK